MSAFGKVGMLQPVWWTIYRAYMHFLYGADSEANLLDNLSMGMSQHGVGQNAAWPSLANALATGTGGTVGETLSERHSMTPVRQSIRCNLLTQRYLVYCTYSRCVYCVPASARRFAADTLS